MKVERWKKRDEAEEEKEREGEDGGGRGEGEEKVIILLEPGLIHFAVDIIVIVRRQARWISAREASRKSAIFSVPI